MKATNAPGGENIPKNRINNTAALISVKAIFLSIRFRRFCFNNHPLNGYNEEAGDGSSHQNSEILISLPFGSAPTFFKFRIVLQALCSSKTNRQLSSEHAIHANLIRVARLTPARRSDQTAAAGQLRQERDACGWRGACPRRRYCDTFGRERPGCRRRCWPGYGRGARWRG